MNKARIIQDIKDNLHLLPEKFTSGAMYREAVDCYCIFGWLGKVTGIDPAANKPSYAAWLAECPVRYEESDNENITAIADNAINSLGGFVHTGDMHCIPVCIAPARAAIEEFLEQLAAA